MLRRTVLAPSLKTGHIVVMDNLSSHTGPKMLQAIQARGCQVRFLPASSPDLSLIEEAFSKFKGILRRVGARTREDLFEAISAALELITPQDALGWFTHCGSFCHLNQFFSCLKNIFSRYQSA